ncbi:hypothetical protein [Lactobacillus kunkeei] [Dolosigranulum pigrum]|nr:hypothetical protein [Lactobacillus kunkeei] [Dolosigranulum pigrum]
MIKRLFVSGYRSYELGIFSEDDDKLFFMKEFLKASLSQYIQNGLEWVITSGQLGIELWTAEIVEELRDEYPNLQLGLLLPYQEYGNSWNEKNQLLLQKAIEQADYMNYTSHEPYKHGGQLSGNAQFILNNTDGLLLIYDNEYEGKSSYLYEQVKAHQEAHDYLLDQIYMDDLQSFVADYQERN